jgi:hypothetical protein
VVFDRRTSRPAISKHLRLLRSVGLADQEGATRICARNAKPLRAISDWLRDYETFWDQRLHNLKNYVYGPKGPFS